MLPRRPGASRTLQRPPGRFLDASWDTSKNFDFHEIFDFFRIIEKSFLHKNSAPGNRMDTTNAFLDRSWPNAGKKIGPVSIEHRFCAGTIFRTKNYKKSWALLGVKCPPIRITLRAVKALRVTFCASQLTPNLHARGKPSTVVHRARDP